MKPRIKIPKYPELEKCNCGRLFPIQDGPAVPWPIMVRFEKFIERNHTQTLERLSQRGGLSMAETITAIKGERLKYTYMLLKTKNKEEIREIFDILISAEAKALRDVTLVK